MGKWWRESLPIYQALLWVIISVFVFSGGPASYLFYRGIKKKNETRNPRYLLRRVFINSPQEEHVPPDLFLHLLKDNIDRVSLYDIRLSNLEEKLMEFPIFEKATVALSFPDALEITYQMKKPFMFLQDVENAALDQRGVLIPFHPYYSPKNLPQLYLKVDTSSLTWGSPLQSQKLQFAAEVYNFLDKNFSRNWEMKSIDLQDIQNEEGRNQQFVVTLKNTANQSEWRLKLNPKNYDAQLIRFESYTIFEIENSHLNEENENVLQNEVDLRLAPMLIHSRSV